MEPRNTKECDKRNSHISSKIHMVIVTSRRSMKGTNLVYVGRLWLSHSQKVCYIKWNNWQIFSFRVPESDSVTVKIEAEGSPETSEETMVHNIKSQKTVTLATPVTKTENCYS